MSDFLGVTIQENLDWKKHIYHVRNKLLQCIGVLDRLKDILHLRILLIIYYSKLFPYLNYSNMIQTNSKIHTNSTDNVKIYTKPSLD